eukprot:923148-Prorocentrum_lima.AAC.1
MQDLGELVSQTIADTLPSLAPVTSPVPPGGSTQATPVPPGPPPAEDRDEDGDGNNDGDGNKDATPQNV